MHWLASEQIIHCRGRSMRTKNTPSSPGAVTGTLRESQLENRLRGNLSNRPVLSEWPPNSSTLRYLAGLQFPLASPVLAETPHGHLNWAHWQL